MVDLIVRYKSFLEVSSTSVHQINLLYIINIQSTYDILLKEEASLKRCSLLTARKTDVRAITELFNKQSNNLSI